MNEIGLKCWRVNPLGRLMCCISCGRETANKRGLCGRCQRHGSVQFDERFDRHSLSSLAAEGCAEGMDFYDSP